MWIFFLELVGLSLFANFIAGTPKKNKGRQISFQTLQFILCFFVILVCNFCFLSLSNIEDFRTIIDGEITLNSIENIFYLALWIAVQLIISALLGIALRAWNFRGIGKATRLLPRKMFTGIGSTLIVSWVLLISIFSVKTSAEAKLVINEVCSDNESVLADKEGNYKDYIELYNPTRFNIELSSYYLTDDLDNQPKQVSSDMIIAAGDYAIVWPNEGEHSFGISSSGGEIVYLLNSAGDILDSVEVPQLEADTVYARNPLDQQWGIYFYPTPLQKNSTTKEQVEAPIFSAEAGFYESAFTLELSAAKDCDIYYTLDGSIPDENAQLYTSGIEVMNVCDQPNVYRAVQNVVLDWEDYTPTDENVDKAFIVRAVAVDEEGNESDVITKTYFVDMDEYQDKYVLSLVSDPDDLFGEDGIYVTGKEYDEWYTGGQEGKAPTANFMRRGRDYEIDTSLEVFDNSLLFSQSAGLRIQSNSHRQGALKRLALYSRQTYSGSRYFNYDLFEILTHSFILREDFADAFLQSLIPDRELGGLEAVPVSVFLDGEFWYDTYIRQKYSEDYLAQTFNLNRDEITLVSAMPDEIYEFIDEHDLSIAENYEEFGEIIDVQNYIDFLAYNIYINNIDIAENNINLRMWKSDSFDDGKWRFLIFDVDAVYWADSDANYEEYLNGFRSYSFNTFSDKRSDLFKGSVAFDQQTIFMALKANEDFCKQFVLTFMDFANTYFEKDHVEQELIAWGYDLSWCNGFFEKRFDYIVPNMAEEFDLTGTLEQITLKVGEVDAGSIKINTVTPELSDGEWSGYYYTDYPVTILAEPAEGYEFVAWHHGDEIYTEQELEVELTEDDNLWEAEFVRTGD